MESQPQIVEIDLTRGNQHEHPDLNDWDDFLALHDGKLLVGSFSRQWYGWNFNCGTYDAGLQFDTPGSNHSRWQRLWRIAVPGVYSHYWPPQEEEED